MTSVKNLREAGPLVSGSESKQIRSGFVVLEKGKEIEGETKTVHAPASTLIPANTRYSIKNKSEGPLKYVYVYVMGLDAAWIG